jgi:hypothetical protein
MLTSPWLNKQCQLILEKWANFLLQVSLCTTISCIFYCRTFSYSFDLGAMTGARRHARRQAPGGAPGEAPCEAPGAICTLLCLFGQSSVANVTNDVSGSQFRQRTLYTAQKYLFLNIILFWLSNKNNTFWNVNHNKLSCNYLLLLFLKQILQILLCLMCHLVTFCT